MRLRYVRAQVLIEPDGRRPGDGDTVRLIEPTVYDVDGQRVAFHFRHLSEATHSLALRLLGVDAPEETYTGSALPGLGMPRLHEFLPSPPQQEPWASRAKQFTDAFLQRASSVTVELDQQMFDRFGRLLGYLYLGEHPSAATHVNLQLLRSGSAALYQVFPNLLQLDDFAAAVAQAQAARQGLWPDLEDQRVLSLDEVRQQRALNPPFVYRKLVDASIADVPVSEAFQLTGRWVGDTATGRLCEPEDWHAVPHARRVFFDKRDQALGLGYHLGHAKQA